VVGGVPLRIANVGEAGDRLTITDWHFEHQLAGGHPVGIGLQPRGIEGHFGFCRPQLVQVSGWLAVRVIDGIALEDLAFGKRVVVVARDMAGVASGNS
jgi:hypothetical protein